MIIGLGHKARSGKDTVADYLVAKHGFRKGFFAEPMKEAARVIFGFNDDQLYGKLKEKADPFWNSKLNFVEKNGQLSLGEMDQAMVDKGFRRVDVTPRVILQLIGTEAGRDIFGDNIWVLALMRFIEKSGHDRWVISDVRYPNEANAILDGAGLVYRVDRDVAGASNGVTGHPSETALLTYDRWSGVIENNGTLEELFAKADALVKGR